MNDEIKPAKREHLQYIIDLCDVCGLSRRDIALLRKNIDRSDYLMLVLLRDEAVAGFIEAQIIADEIHLYDVAVDPKFRKQGVARDLIEEISLPTFRAILLEVRESNQAALQLYKKCGFSIDGIRKNYYSAPVENAVLMSRKIS
jgi:[ribosomal protein S18]-alanine N-acetyltransferase